MSNVPLSDLVDPAKLAELRAAVGDDSPKADSDVVVEEAGGFEQKADTPGVLERKADPGLGGAQVLSADDETGVVEAIVSVTGVEDKVKDTIEPGAYTKTIANHEPIGVWSHDDKTWVARTEDAVELMPGDPFFKGLKTMDGQPWPAAAGAVKVKARFNLETTHGREAYSDVKFFQGKTGWSIGYRATKAYRNPRTGQRSIKELDWFEYSPVMVGAASQPMTLSVKSLAQPVDPDEGVDLVDVDTLSEDEVKARDALRTWLEVKDRVRTPEGAARFGQPIGTEIHRSKVKASQLLVGDHVDFQGMGPGGPSDPKPVKGNIEAIEKDGNIVTIQVNGEKHKLIASNPMTVDRAEGTSAPHVDAPPAKDAAAGGPISNAQLQKLFGEATTDDQKAKIRAALKLPEDQRHAFLAGEAAEPKAGEVAEPPAKEATEAAPAKKPDPTRTGSLASRMRADEAQSVAASQAAGAKLPIAQQFPKGSTVSYTLGGKESQGKVTGHSDLGGGMEPQVIVEDPQMGTMYLDASRVSAPGGGKADAPAAAPKKAADAPAAPAQSDPPLSVFARRRMAAAAEAQGGAAPKAADAPGGSADKPKRARQTAADRERAMNAEADATVAERAKLAALNKRRRAQGKLPLLKLPPEAKHFDLEALEFYGDVLDAESKMVHEPLNRSPKQNWIEKVGGQLPAYVQHIAKDISEQRGVPLDHAIPIAISRIKLWAAGGGGVKPDTKAKAAAALAEWEALKAKAGVKYDSELMDELEQKALDLEDAVEDAWALLYEVGEFKTQVGTSPDYVQVDEDGEVVGTATVEPVDEPVAEEPADEESKSLLLSPDELLKAAELRRALL